MIKSNQVLRTCTKTIFPVNPVKWKVTWPLSSKAVVPLFRLFARNLVVLLVVLGVVSVAAAQDKKTVQAGAKTTVATSNNKIEDKSGPLKGTVRVKASDTDPKTYILEYEAPKVSSDITETIRYTDGTDHTVSVFVAAIEPPTLTSNDIYAQSFKALFILFIIATLLESGLAVIFNWRPFIQLFDTRGVKTIIAVLFAWFFVEVFDLDVVTRLANLYQNEKHPSSFPGVFITSLILAGGSSAVNNLFVALGFRSMKTAEQVTPKPTRNEAWISVRLIRASAKGPVSALIWRHGGPLSVAGTITGASRSGGLVGFFLRDYGRFPTAGGYSVPPEIQYEVKLRGVDATGKTIESETWGPLALTAGAIVDIELKL